MESITHNDIVDRQSHWLDHIRRSDERQQSLSEYAKANNLKVTRLYYWNKRLKTLGLLPVDKSTVSFATVQVTQPAQSSTLACRLRFPNDMVMEWDSSQGIALEQLLSMVHRLP